MNPSGSPGPGRPARRRRLPLGRTTRSLGAATLGAQAGVLVFALPVAVTLGDLPTGVALGVGIPAALACAALAGLLRYRWAYLVASLLQLVVLAGGQVVPGLWLIGGVFVLLWVLALVLGTRADRLALGADAGPGEGTSQVSR